MKYLKLYEAFSSNTLSKLYKHLKKKNVNTKSLNLFKEDLTTISRSLDIPMDKISDDDVSYLLRKRALILKNDEKVDNEYGIWAIKFWFDKDGEYIGTSATGNKNIKSNKKYSKQSKPFNSNQWAKIKGISAQIEIGVPKTGILEPILQDEYDLLKTGDKVIATLCSSESYEDENVRSLTFGKIFIDNNSIFIVHNNSSCDGMEPYNNPWEIYPDIKWGSYYWVISENGSLSEDHFNLHRYIKSDEPLDYAKSDEHDESKNPFNYNLSLVENEEGDLEISSWIDNMDEKSKIESNGDFAIILYVDSILNRGLKSPKETNTERVESRKNATALMSDADFKKINLEKYISIIVKEMGVTPESLELKKLQNFIAKLLSSGIESYSLLSIMATDYRYIDGFTYSIKKLISGYATYDKSMINHLYKSFLSEYKSYKKEFSKNYSDRKTIMDSIKNRSKLDSQLKPVFDIIMRISNKITKSILSKDISRGEDLKKINFKIKSIYSMMNDSEFQVSKTLETLLKGEYIVTKERINDYLDYYLTQSYDIESDIIKLKEIESYVDDIMK